MKLLFSKDRRSFSGKWNDEGKEHTQNFVWRGHKNSTEIKLAEMAINAVSIDEILNRLVVYHFSKAGEKNPLVHKHKKIFFDYFLTYMSLEGVRDDLISFCITEFTQKELHKMNQNPSVETKDRKIIKKAIVFQSIVIGKTKADFHFNDLKKRVKNRS